jgi:hypothetical protein
MNILRSRLAIEGVWFASFIGSADCIAIAIGCVLCETGTGLGTAALAGA